MPSVEKPQKNLCLLIFQQCYVRLMDKCPIFKIFHESYLKELPRVNVDDLLSSSYINLIFVIVKLLTIVVFFTFWYML